MANAKTSNSGGQGAKKRAPANTALRQHQQALDAERPSRHFCVQCGENILRKDLQMVMHSKVGGHRVMEPHHKVCFK